MKIFTMKIDFFNQKGLLQFEEKFPFWDLFLCHVAQIFPYPVDFDEDIQGEMIYLWIDENGNENVVTNEFEFQVSLAGC